MAVLITNNQNLLKIQTEQFRKIAQALLNDLDSPDGELSIFITDDENIAEINKAYFNKPWPTNVISFSMIEGEFVDVNPEAKLLGDIVISVETALREAKEADVPAEDRLVMLLIHGLLHIFGYDHETPESDEAMMERKSEEMWGMLEREGLRAG